MRGLTIQHKNQHKIILAALIVALLLVSNMRTSAQGQELLSNNNMEEYYGIGGPNVVPMGWRLISNIPVGTAKQVWQFENQQFGGSWHVSTMSAAFNMTAVQFVPGVKTGTPLRFTAWANIFTCNKENSCIEGDRTYRLSDQSSGARVRIGIDPTGGQDGGAATVVWSPFMSPFDNFQQIIVETISKNDNGVTVFLFFATDVSMLLNNVYWDNASLLAVGAIQPGAGGTPLVPTNPPFIALPVTPQATQADGSIVHVVRAGDTLATIAGAYGVTVAQIRELNNIQPGDNILQIGQKLIIKKAESNVVYVVITATNTPGGVVETPSFGSVTNATPTTPPVVVVLPTNTPVEVVPPTQAPTVTTAPSATPPSASDPTAASICISSFDDANGNRFQDVGERLVGGVQLVLTPSDQTLSTNGTAPVCFTGLAAGTYSVLGTAPAGAILTTSDKLAVAVKAGVKIDLVFGVSGVAVAEAPGSGSSGSMVEMIVGNARAAIMIVGGIVLIGNVALMIVTGQ